MSSSYEIINIQPVMKGLGVAVKSVTDKKVDKEEGNSLISNTDIIQISTNKTDIGSLTTRVASIETQLEGLAALLEELV